MGGFLGLLNKLSFFKVQRDTDLCKDCQACSNICPVGLNVQTIKTAPKGECISCGECVDKCKGKMALSFFIGKKQVSTGVTALLVFVIFFGIIGVTKGIELYSSTPPSIEALKKQGGMLPDHIKGYMSLKEVAYLFDIPLTDLYSELRLDDTVIPPDMNCRDIGGILNADFETDQVRLAVARLLKIPETEVAQSCSSSGPVFIPGTMTLGQVSSTFKIQLPVLYDKLGLSMERIPPTTACRDLKFLVSPDFHTTKVREAVSELLSE
jgi:ferredoxin